MGSFSSDVLVCDTADPKFSRDPQLARLDHPKQLRTLVVRYVIATKLTRVDVGYFWHLKEYLR